MSGSIRLRYSGLVAFGSRIVSMLTGLIFIIIVTRNLSVADFGIWQYISIILGYAVFPSSFLPFWITRFYARGYSIGKTGVVSNLIIASVAFLIFIFISIPASNIIKTDISYFYITGTQIFVMYLYASLRALAQGRYPHLIGYAEMLFEIAKIIFAFLLFYVLRMGLVGAIIAVIFAYAVGCLFYLSRFIGEIGEDINWSLSKKWFSRIWVAAPDPFAGFLYSLDLLVLALIIHQPEPLALYRVAASVAVTTHFAASLAIALYPRLLSGGGIRDVEEILKLCLMFSIPMAVGTFVLAEPLLHLFKSDYETATPLLKLMSVWAPMVPLIVVMENVIFGSVKVDLDVNVSFKKLMSSMLIVWPLTKYIRAFVALPLIYLFVKISLEYFPQQPYLYATIGCFLANFIADILLFLLAYQISRKALQFKFPIKNLTRYLGAATVMGLLVWIIHPARSYETVLTVAVGSFVYFAVLSLIDSESRKLFKDVWAYLQSSRKETTIP
ncbi:MAG: polysaccharide biosynthesis C-terminal domain-containing protein [Candidatus Bathyarchaeia archaeon]